MKNNSAISFDFPLADRTSDTQMKMHFRKARPRDAPTFQSWNFCRAEDNA